MKTKDQIVEELIGVIEEIQERSDHNFDLPSEELTADTPLKEALGDTVDFAELLGIIRGAYGVWVLDVGAYGAFVAFPSANGTISELADEIIAHLGKGGAQ